MDRDVVFTTDRLVVRHWRPGDEAAVLAIYGDPEVARWTSTPVPMTTLDEAAARLTTWAETRDDVRGFGLWAIVPEVAVAPVGILLLRPLADSDEVEIGWTLHPAVHGRGYATEAARGAVAHARAHDHRRIRAIMWPDNEPSKAVCARLGMTSLGEVDDPWYGTTEYPTSLMFTLDL